MVSGISTKDLLKARRSAERKRASVACVRCKAAKTKCSDYRPCKKCTYSNMAGGCVDEGFSTPHPADTMSSNSLSDASVHGSGPFVVQAGFPTDRVSTMSTTSGFHTCPAPAFGAEIPHLYSAGSLFSWLASSSDYPTAGTAELKNTRNGNLQGDSSQEPTRYSQLMLGPHVSTVTNLLANSVLSPPTPDSPLPNMPLDFPQMPRSYPEPNHLLSLQMLHISDHNPRHRTTWPFPPIFPPPMPLLLGQVLAAPQTPQPTVAQLNFGSTMAGIQRLATPYIDPSLLLALLPVGAAPHQHRWLSPIGEGLAPLPSPPRR
jgi:hypothetical protein